jgi:uncharacterized DUF497 family protein
MSIKFEWDPRKARRNLRKPGVVYTEEGETIRIINARIADRLERRKYEEGDS